MVPSAIAKVRCGLSLKETIHCATVHGTLPFPDLNFLIYKINVLDEMGPPTLSSSVVL